MVKHNYFRLVLIIVLAGLAAGCGKDPKPTEPMASVAETEMLLAYLEENGDLLNSPHVPSLIDAEVLYNQLVASNTHVIDVRSPESFAAGHIAYSVNVEPGDILTHFEERIDPTAFDQIVLVCDNAQVSNFVTAVLIFLGYDNVAALRFGLSSWDEDIAENNWLAAVSDHLADQLETTPNPKNEAGHLPALKTGYSNPYQVLRQRAHDVLQANPENWNVNIDRLMENQDAFYIMNYWPENLYLRGHLPGAIQYTPKSSLHSSTFLHTLPVDQPLLLYCFTAQHSAYAKAFLRLLGYDAYHLAYGANAYMHTILKETERPTRSFTENTIRHLPLSGRDASAPVQRDPNMSDEPVPVIGGC